MRGHMSPEALELPKELEHRWYRAAFADLAHMDDDQLTLHYETFGRSEGRSGNRLCTRNDFLALIPQSARVIEFGPFCAPVFTGVNTKYFDVFDKAGLEQRAKEIGYHHLSAPFIHFVSATGDLSTVDETFDFAVSSHCIEHQPDFIEHLKQVSRIITDNGRYFLLVPDKRYCFDAFLAESNEPEILEAHFHRRKTHTHRSVLEYRALITHNDSALHWTGQHGNPYENLPQRLAAALAEYESSAGAYIDVHAWQFTPESLCRILRSLSALDYIDLDIERMYPTRRGHNEFWCILKKAN